MSDSDARIERVIANAKLALLAILRGGPGSGNFGHEGRPGEVGGSAPGEGGENSREFSRYLEANQRSGGEPLGPTNLAEAVEQSRLPIGTAEWEQRRNEWEKDLRSMGDAKIETAAWIGPSGAPLGHLADHQETALALLRWDLHALGENSRSIATDLAVLGGLVRYNSQDSETYFDIPSLRHTTDGQWATMAAVVTARAFQDGAVPDVLINVGGAFSPIESYEGDDALAKLGLDRADLIRRGGPGSGHFGHEGRPGERGGSAPGEGGEKETEGEQPSVPREVGALARSHHARAAAAEPDVTSLVTTLGEMMGAKAEGLDFRLKTEESLARKIATIADEMGITPEEAAEEVNDSLRYTLTMDREGFVENVLAIQNELAAEGWEMWDTAWRNYFAPGDDYDGYNTVLYNPESGQKFELQFHTPESYSIKHESWAIYNRWRNTHEDGPIRADLYRQMQDLWQEDYGRPEDWQRLPGVMMGAEGLASVAP